MARRETTEHDGSSVPATGRNVNRSRSEEFWRGTAEDDTDSPFAPWYVVRSDDPLIRVNEQDSELTSPSQAARLRRSAQWRR
jgi:hypothetical protein